MSYDSLYLYLGRILESSESASSEKSIHEIVKKLNAMTGLYWIVCSWKLIDVLKSDDDDRSGGNDPLKKESMNAKFRSVFESLLMNHKLVPNEDGGLLRCFSAIQLSEILGFQHREIERIATETVDMVTQICTTKSVPFWFDMRSMYCMLGILRISKNLEQNISTECRIWLRDWIYQSQTILGGFGANPKAEAHGGYTFCAVTSLVILGQEIPRKDRLVAWCNSRLSPRFNGRPGKPSDSCYVWWIMATLKNLGTTVDTEKIEQILWKHFYTDQGGFSKYPSIPILGDNQSIHGKQDADLFHTFLVIASLALFRNKIDSVCVIPIR